MKKVAKRAVSFALAVMMIFTSMLFGVTEEVKADDYTYTLTITKGSEAVPSSAMAVTVGEANTFNAKLTVSDSNGVVAEYDTTDEYTAAGLKLSWWVSSGTEDNLTCSDAWEADYSVTANVAGEYWFGVGVYQNSDPWGQMGSTVWFGINATEASAPTYTLEILQGDTVISELSPAEAAAIVDEDAVLTAKITKTDANGTTEITDLTGYNLYWYDQATGNTTSNVLTYTVNKSEVDEYWYDVTLKDANDNPLKTTWFGINVTEEEIPEYGITVTPSNPVGKEGETVTLTATVTVDGTATTDLTTNNLAVYWWTDDNANEGVTYNSTGSTLTNTITLNKAGEYEFAVKLQNSQDPWNTWKTETFTLTVEEAEVPVIDYDVTITPEKTELTKGDKVKLTAALTIDDVAVTDLETSGVQVKWSLDEEGLTDATFDADDALVANATLPSEGTYIIVVEVLDADDNVLATASVELVAEAPANEVEKVNIPNTGFESALEGVWSATAVSGTWKDATTYKTIAYTDPNVNGIEKPSNAGNYCFKFDLATGDKIDVVQWLDELEAGTYTISMKVMGENTKVALVFGSYDNPQISSSVSVTGWNEWKTVKATFTITEDMSDVQVGFRLTATGASGAYNWGYADNFALYKGVPATGDINPVWTYVILMLSGVAVTVVGMKKKRA